MNSLSLPKVSELMKPLERAKLVISLELKEAGEMGTDGKATSIENDIKQIVAACPNSQIRDYNFYISLKACIWKLMIMVEINQSYLETLDSRMILVRHLLAISPTLYDCLQTLKGKQVDTVDREQDAVISQLESLAQMKVDNNKLELVNPIFREALLGFKNRFRDFAEEIRGYAEIVEKAEQKHFDGMEIVSRDPTHPMGVISRATAAIKKAMETHNDQLREVVEGFNLLGMGSVEYRWEQISEFLLEGDFKANADWVDKKLVDVEEEAGRWLH
jgi:hypothetical protein